MIRDWEVAFELDHKQRQDFKSCGSRKGEVHFIYPTLFELHNEPYKLGIITIILTPIFQIKKLRVRTVKKPTHSQMASKW